VWVWRLVAVVVVFAVLDVASVVLDFAPAHGRLALLVALCLAVVAVVWDSLGDSGPPWSAEPDRPMTTAGSDARLAYYVRLLENHRTAASPDGALRDLLVELCDERLARHHGLTRQDPSAEALLGDDLLRDLAGPVRRLHRAEIDDYLERIEQL
jgi:hypothetical protein